MVKKPRGEYATVVLPKGLVEEVEKFLRTKPAYELGLNSKSDVVSEAVRQFIAKHKPFA